MLPDSKTRRAAATALLVSAALAGASAVGAADDHLHMSVAAARPGMGALTAGKPDRLDFVTFDFRAWLRSNGEWHVETEVAHRGFLCANYETGLRFGIGSPGCTNVEWIGELRYATSRYQCNDAATRHIGGDTQPELASRFAEITCAQRVIRCNGSCQEVQPGYPSDRMRRDEFRPER